MQQNTDEISVKEARTDNQRPVDLALIEGDWTASWSMEHWPAGNPPKSVHRALEQWLIQKLDLPTEVPESKTYVDDVESYSLEEFRENPVKGPRSGSISEIVDVEWHESEQELIVHIREDLTVSA